MKVMGKEISKKQLITGITIGAVIILIIVIVAITKMTGNKSSATPVNIHTVAKQPVSSSITSTGIVESKLKETLYSETNTTVKDVLEVGDVVLAGGVVVSFTQDTKVQLERELQKLNVQLEASNKIVSDLRGKASQQEILQAESALSQINASEEEIKDSIKSQETSVNQLKRELESSNELLNKQKQLYEEEIISKQEYDEFINMNQGIRDQLEMARIQLGGIEQSLNSLSSQRASASYNLDLANNKVEDKAKRQQIEAKEAEIASINLQKEGLKDDIAKAKTELRTPIDGVVSEVMVDKNALAAPGAPLLTVLDISDLQITTDISTFNVNQVKLDQEVVIKQDNMEGTEYLGTVSEIEPMASAKQSGTATSNVVPVTIELNEDKTTLQPGFNVEVRIKTVSKDDALTVPILAVLEDSDEDYKYVFVINEDNKLEKRKVTELTLDNIFVEVEGVSEGDRVVAEADDDLEEGMLVEEDETGDM